MDPCSACGGDCNGSNCPAKWAREHGWKPPSENAARPVLITQRRDEFARAAMQGMTSLYVPGGAVWSRLDNAAELAERAYAIADAMLAERAKS